ncbi:hypothetical protein [Texcoconibacillus texcoconensis]|uniref:Uncharacterized protein n=1 Tax=Texcoconibacillus texcoconensis TaxID=1095777 RepID=A0A840QT43_9BACI|nr:hypothetical protein [Texcoconibacillus texcoconensis]MBB5174535.1 hypothetical protein [Texcoconibacillus texcoconensis]
MKIQTQHLYHGSVLTQITEHHSFKALNKVDDIYGHYLVNHDTRLFVKYLTKEASPWNFQFHGNELEAIRNDIQAPVHVFLCLVCGEETICALDYQEFSNLIDVTSTERQVINVEVPPSGSMHVSGSLGELEQTIRHNSFPEKIFTNADEGAEVAK